MEEIIKDGVVLARHIFEEDIHEGLKLLFKGRGIYTGWSVVI